MRVAKRRTGSILAVAVLSVLAVVALYWARDTDQYSGNLLLNIGASFVGAVVTYALINPLMTRAESRAEKILDHFDHGSVRPAQSVRPTGATGVLPRLPVAGA